MGAFLSLFVTTATLNSASPSSMENGNGGLQLPETRINIPEHEAAHLYLHSPYGATEKRNYRDKGRCIYIAATKGIWDDAKDILRENPCVYITEGLETALHISALANKPEFVKELLTLITNPIDLEILNKSGNTALCLAAANGNVEIAQLMINRHPQLCRISGYGGTQPVMMAATLGNREMVEYIRLQLHHTNPWTDEEDTKLLTLCISSNLFDVAHKLIELKPILAVSETAWDMLAGKPMADKNKRGKWKRFTDSWASLEEAHENSLKFQSYDLLKIMLHTAFKEDLEISNIVRKAPHYLFDASKRGNFELFKLILDYFPELVWIPNSKKLSMFHVAIVHRNERIFTLLHKMDEVKRLVTTYCDDETGDNMLHLAAKLAPLDKLNSVTGAAFQMQEAILWYKEVEKIVPPSYRNMQNAEGKTPSDIFDEEQKCLLKEGAKWMKATAKSCMLVATLIAGVIFAAAFTVPGGNTEEGYPYFLERLFFNIFSVSDIIGMFSSSTSIVIFLSIHTGRINKYAFKHSLPIKLMTGLTTLFVSIATMVIAFCTTIFLSYQHASTPIPILLILFVCVPITFISLKFRLLVDIVSSTFVSSLMFGSRN